MIMIRQAATHSIPPPILLREVYDEEGEQRNNRIKFRHAIHNIPFEASRVARTLRENRMRLHLSKRIFLQCHIPTDVLDHLKDYLYDNHHGSMERLPSKGYSRTVHHLIHTECIAPHLVEVALAVGKRFDACTYVYGDSKVFRSTILRYVNDIQTIDSW